MENLVEQLSTLKPTEVLDLVKRLEEKWGMTVPVAVPQTVMPQIAFEPTVIEKESFNVNLISFGESKMKVIIALRSIKTLGLAEAKKLVESAPVIILEDLSKEDAENAKKQLEAAGAKIEL